MGNQNSLGSSPPRSSYLTPSLWLWSSGSGVEAHSLHFYELLGGWPCWEHSTNICVSPTTSNTESCTLKCWKENKRIGQVKAKKTMTCASAGLAVSREATQHATCPCVQAVPWQPSPAQPSSAGKYGVVSPCWSALHSPLPWLCFDRCVQGWMLPARCLLGKRSWRKACRFCPAPWPTPARGAVRLLGREGGAAWHF